MSTAVAPAPITAGTNVKDGDHVVFTDNYKANSGVYALRGDTGKVVGEIVYEDDVVMAFIVELDRPRVKGFDTLYVAPDMVELAPGASASNLD